MGWVGRVEKMKMFSHPSDPTFTCAAQQTLPFFHVFIEIHLTLFDSQPGKYILASVLWKKMKNVDQIPFSD